MTEQSLEIVVERNHFYRDGYRKLSLIFMVLLTSAIMLFFVNSHLSKTQKRPPEFFAMTCDGNFASVIPLSEPMVSDAKLLAWANRVITSVYSFDFVHFREQLEDSSHYFTARGWQEFGRVFQSARNLETVLEKNLLVSAVPTAAPLIEKRGVINGLYTWQVSMPILVTYQSNETNIQQALDVIINIQRVSMYRNSDGIAISQYIASEGK